MSKSTSHPTAVPETVGAQETRRNVLRKLEASQESVPALIRRSCDSSNQTTRIYIAVVSQVARLIPSGLSQLSETGAHPSRTHCSLVSRMFASLETQYLISVTLDASFSQPTTGFGLREQRLRTVSRKHRSNRQTRHKHQLRTKGKESYRAAKSDTSTVHGLVYHANISRSLSDATGQSVQPWLLAEHRSSLDTLPLHSV
jgi:leucyl aminopeptidase